MAWYYGTFSCGCEGRTNITGPTKNRQWIADKRFSNLCEKCYKAKIEEDNKKSNEAAVPFNGEINQKNRQRNLDKFRGESRFLVANKQCGAYGLNLQFCKYIIYYSNDWDYATRAQSEDRVHRIGQNEKVNIIDICAGYTLDERIIKCLERKENLVESFKDGIEKIKDKKELLEWLSVKKSYRYNNKTKVQYKNVKVNNLDRSDLIVNDF